MIPNLPLGLSQRDLEPRDVESEIEREIEEADEKIDIEREDNSIIDPKPVRAIDRE